MKMWLYFPEIFQLIPSHSVNILSDIAELRKRLGADRRVRCGLVDALPTLRSPGRSEPKFPRTILGQYLPAVFYYQPVVAGGRTGVGNTEKHLDMVLLSYRGDETLDLAIFGVDNSGLDLVAAADVLTGGELEEDEEQNVDTPCTRILMEHGQQTPRWRPLSFPLSALLNVIIDWN